MAAWIAAVALERPSMPGPERKAQRETTEVAGNRDDI
jgi:hypothetical protein